MRLRVRRSNSGLRPALGVNLILNPKGASHGILWRQRRIGGPRRAPLMRFATMSLREAEQQPHRSEHDRALDDQRVMTIDQWCEVNGLSRWTGQRLIKSGQGPKILQLSPRRIGVTVRANREWQQARERA
jgi:predicted DNA-binding transcriptional regulator AlpA